MKARTIILTLALVVSGFTAGATGPNRDRSGWHGIWRNFGVDPEVAESVIWPEYQLYSGLRDMAEATADYCSYVSGIGRFDFSIGIFQMKPSFVEKLEKAWMDSGLASVYSLYFDVSDTSSVHHERISRMGVDNWQVIYLAMFLRLLYRSYGSLDASGACVQEGLEALPVEDQVRLAATAYNRGCKWTDAGCGNLEDLRAYSYVVSFPRVLIKTSATHQYCYATLSCEHYREVAGKL